MVVMCKHLLRLARRGTRLWVLAVILTAPRLHGLAEDAGIPHWLTAEDLLRQRQQPVRLTCSGTPLRDVLADLSKAQRVAILLDRRIDPDQTIDVTANRISLDTLFDQISGKIDASASWLGPLAFLGPHDAASRLRTLAALRAADVRALAKDKRAVFQHQAAWHWQALAEPRNLVAELATAANVEVESLDLIGHDLWPAANLPPLSWSDRLTLIANEFDLTFEIIDTRHVRLKSIAGPVAIERTYPGGKQPEELAGKWRQRVPGAQIEVARGKVVVRGRLEDHELLTQSKKPKPAPMTTPGAELYTLRVQEQPLSAVFDKLQQQLSVDLQVDDAALEKANLSLQTRVSFNVEQVTLDELLTVALKPAGLAFRREGNTYRIVPAAP
jgi:hypothetical protein